MRIAEAPQGLGPPEYVLPESRRLGAAPVRSLLRSPTGTRVRGLGERRWQASLLIRMK